MLSSARPLSRAAVRRLVPATLVALALCSPAAANIRVGDDAPFTAAEFAQARADMEAALAAADGCETDLAAGGWSDRCERFRARLLAFASLSRRFNRWCEAEEVRLAPRGDETVNFTGVCTLSFDERLTDRLRAMRPALERALAASADGRSPRPPADLVDL